MNTWYYLNENREPVEAEPFELYVEWAKANPKGSRVGHDVIIGRDPLSNADVSTVFLALDHNHWGGEPILWETMVFGGDLDQEQERCSGSWADAEAMHQRMCERVRAGRPPE